MITLKEKHEISASYFSSKIYLDELEFKHGNKYSGGLLVCYLLGKCEEFNHVDVQIDVICDSDDEDDEMFCIYNKQEFKKNFKTINAFIEYFDINDVESWNVTLNIHGEEIRLFGMLDDPDSYNIMISYEAEETAMNVIRTLEGMSITI